MSNRLGIAFDWLFMILWGGFSFALPYGVWELNPVWLVLFARVSNFAFVNVHFTSVAAISLVCIYLVLRDRKTIRPFRWVSVVFAGAGLHEWMIFIWSLLLGAKGIAPWQDAIWFAAFISLGVAFGNRKQRIILGILATYLFVLMGIYVGYFHDSDLEIGTYTMQAVADNGIEVFGWVTTALAFVL